MKRAIVNKSCGPAVYLLDLLPVAAAGYELVFHVKGEWRDDAGNSEDAERMRC
jgi:hypothetical protein